MQGFKKILLIIDGEKVEFTTIFKTCTDTWAKFVKVLKVRQFTSENEKLVSVQPEFAEIQYTPGIEDRKVEHLTTSQRAMHAADISAKNLGLSVSESAKKMKVSRSSVHVAKKIKQTFPVLAKRIRDGRQSLHDAEMEIVKLKLKGSGAEK